MRRYSTSKTQRKHCLLPLQMAAYRSKESRNLETGAEMAYSEQVCVELGPWNAVILEILEEKKYENA